MNFSIHIDEHDSPRHVYALADALTAYAVSLEHLPVDDEPQTCATLEPQEAAAEELAVPAEDKPKRQRKPKPQAEAVEEPEPIAVDEPEQAPETVSEPEQAKPEPEPVVTPEPAVEPAVDAPSVVELRAKAAAVGTTPEAKKAIKALLDKFDSTSISNISEDKRADFLAELDLI